MANEEQLSILRQGIDVWNKWREENPEIQVDLRKAFLPGVDLRGVNFGHTNIGKGDALYQRAPNLTWADLRGADLTGANLFRADLSGAHLSRAKFVGVRFLRALFSETDLRGAHLNQSNLQGAVFIRANLREADLTGADLQHVDLAEADLRGADLSGANLSFATGPANLSKAVLVEADLDGALLHRTNFREANLSRAKLVGAHFLEADFTGADLRGASLSRAHLNKANLNKAVLSDANLQRASLEGANLEEANLNGANLQGAFLRGTQLSGATVGDTTFSKLDLAEAIGLEDVEHVGPSQISTDTFVLSRGVISETFLRGCGLPDWEIEGVKLHNVELSNSEVSEILYRMHNLRATQALQIWPLFVSYSHDDSDFVDRISDSLEKEGIRYWRDKHDMKAGRVEKQVDQAIRQNPTVLLVLSEQSLESDWVQHEVRMARELEKELGRDTLCPVALDDSWKSSRWPKRIMEQIMEYNILDFSAWKDDVKFEGMFRKLIDGLELFYKG